MKLKNNTHPLIQLKNLIIKSSINYLKILFLVFQSDSIKVLWSYGEKDPVGNVKGHNKNRGWKNMHLLGPHFKKPSLQKDKTIQQWDVTVKNVSEIFN